MKLKSQDNPCPLSTLLLTFENELRLEEQKGRGCRDTGLDRPEGVGEARPQGGTLLSQPLQPGWPARGSETGSAGTEALTGNDPHLRDRPGGPTLFSFPACRDFMI